MNTQKHKLLISILIAFLLWFVMFSPWTASLIPFWPMMSVSAMLLLTMAFSFRRDWRGILRFTPRALAYGALLAAFLWCVFWLGDKASGIIFHFAPRQIADVYTLREGTSPVVIALLLLLIIGPAEEIFWRGYVQRSLADLYGKNAAVLIAVAVYTLVHIFSFNLMLLAAAALLGCVWSILFRLYPRSLPALIVSHALWDAAVFVFFPFR
ncbi:MAG: CPBP family glutamic-type intramembrane protease [Planctomycetia bacterium]|nr:CPBP family glutamic-type intramembrane protease [Planctomycetia bacterium]